MARLRSAPSAQPPSPEKTQTRRQALREKTNTTRDAKNAPVYENDGNIENLVKNAKPRRGRPKTVSQDEAELVMAGGLGQQESDAPPTTDELAKSDGPPPPTAKANRRPPRMTRKPIQNEAQSKVMEGLKQRMEATAREEAGRKGTGRKGAVKTTAAVPNDATDDTRRSANAPPAESASARKSMSAVQEGRSELSLSPSPPPPGKLSSVNNKRSSLAPPSSVLRPQGTPAAETSILALKNFKRRPRQPSMLAMVQQRTAASARPSAVHVAADEDPSVFDLEKADSEEENEDDFAPEAEGTPLHVSKAKRRVSASAHKQDARPLPSADKKRDSAQAQKRKSGDVDTSSSALDALRAKRRKSEAPALPRDESIGENDARDTVPQTRASARRSSSDHHAMPQHHEPSDVQVINSSPSSTPPTELSSSDKGRSQQETNEDYVIPSTEQREEEEDLYGATPRRETRQRHIQPAEGLDIPNGTMAEPDSSPGVVGPGSDEESDVLADPMTQPTQESPPRVREKSKKEARPMSTAHLQALLPKRRKKPQPRRRKSEYDFTSDEEDEDTLDASHLEDDEDELGGRLRRQTKAAPTKGRKSTAPAKSKAKSSKAAQAARKSSAAPARKSAAPPATARKQTKTYGRAGNASDKENEAYESDGEDEDATDLPEVSMHEVTRSRELEEAKKKFEEVDEWDMEFESMSQDDHRSSSQQWR